MRPKLKALAEQHYRWEIVANEYEALFKQVI